MKGNPKKYSKLLWKAFQTFSVTEQFEQMDEAIFGGGAIARQD